MRSWGAGAGWGLLLDRAFFFTLSDVGSEEAAAAALGGLAVDGLGLVVLIASWSAAGGGAGSLSGLLFSRRTAPRPVNHTHSTAARVREGERQREMSQVRGVLARASGTDILNLRI